MARIRTIKPEFPQSESMGRVSRDARLCFIMLWTIADDSGRLRGSSRMLASLLYPYDDDAASLMDGWLAELDGEGCIRRYKVDGSMYVEIAKWLSHQKIDKPSASRFPAFSDASRILANPRECSSGDLGPRNGVDLVPRSGEDLVPRIAPPALSGKPARKRAAKPDARPSSAATWAAYEEAYKALYGTLPVRNEKQNGMMANFIKRLGADEAPGVARSYLANRNGLYVSAKHCVDLLLRDAEKLRTEWVTGQVTHQRDAREADRLSSTAGMVQRITEELTAKGVQL